MYESMLLLKLMITGWPVIKVVLIAGAAAYAYSKIRKTIHKRKKINLAKTRVHINEKNSEGQTPLMLAENLKEAQILLARGADINAVDNKGNNAAMYAKNSSILSLLIENGIDVTTVNKDGQSALMLNAMYGHDKNMKLLMQNGADKTLKDNNGKSILEHYLKEAISRKCGPRGKIPAGHTIINADILESLLAPNEIDPREKNKEDNVFAGHQRT